MTDALNVKSLSVSFGGLKAVSDLSFIVGAGQVCGLIGPNGAGKTTVLNALTRITTAASGGQALAFGDDLLRMPIHNLIRKGVMRTFQNLELFGELTTLDNIAMGRAFHHRTGYLSELLGLSASKAAKEAAYAEAEAIAQEFDMLDIRDRKVSELSFGTQKNVELARAMCARPRLLLMDEPAAGLNGIESRALGERIRHVAKTRGITVLLVEHDMPLVMSACDKIVVMVRGCKITEGTPEEIRHNPKVIEAYLGESA